MTNLYFSGNLKGLVSEMSKFSSEKETKKFIVNLDVKNFNDIFLYLNNLFFNKLNSDLKNKKITVLEAQQQTKEFRENIIKMHEIIINLRKIETQEIIATEDYKTSKKRSRGNIAISILYILNIIITLILTIMCILNI